MGRRRSETCAAGQWGRTRLRRRLRRRCRCGWMATRSATVLRAPVRLPAEAELRHGVGSCSWTTATAKSLDVEVWTSTSFRFFFSLFFLRAAGLLSSQFRGFVSFSVFHRVIDIFFCFSFANFFSELAAQPAAQPAAQQAEQRATSWGARQAAERAPALQL